MRMLHTAKKKIGEKSVALRQYMNYNISEDAP